VEIIVTLCWLELNAHIAASEQQGRATSYIRAMV
jgi:hypothetical protein